MLKPADVACRQPATSRPFRRPLCHGGDTLGPSHCRGGSSVLRQCGDYQPCLTPAMSPAESPGTTRTRTHQMASPTPREGHTAPLSSSMACSPHLRPFGRERNLPKEQEQQMIYLRFLQRKKKKQKQSWQV